MKSSLFTKHELDSDILRQGRIDLAAALRWAARSGLNEGVCNHFSLELASDRYLINPQEVQPGVRSCKAIFNFGFQESFKPTSQ